MKKLLAVILTIGLVLPAVAQQKRAITHEDLWSLKRVGAPQISPDGQYVIVSVLEPSYDEKEKISDIWITTTDGKGTPRRLTTGKSSESGYSWSPDGKYIAFSAKREGDEVPQLYLLNFKEGGEAQRFTTLSTGASNPVWSPDGKRIAFTSEVYPGALTDSANKKIAADRKGLKYKARVYTTFPIRNWDSWNDEKQTHLFVQDVTEKSTAKDLLAGTALVSKTGFSGESMNATWTPDGKNLVFTASENFTEAAYADVISNLYLISSNGGEPKKLTTDGNQYGAPQLSKDGKWLFYLTNKSIPNSGFEYTLTRIGRTSFPDMSNSETLTSLLDRSVSGYKLSADGSTVYFVIEDEATDKFYSMTSDGKKSQQITAVSGGSYPSFSVSNNDILVAGYESAVMPAEIVRINPKQKNHTNLTNFNSAKLSELDLAPLKHFWFTSSKGKKIHSLMVMPPNFDPNKKYPLFVLIHGGPHIAMKDNFGYRWNYHLLAQPGYVLLMTNYTGSTGYGEKFAQDIQGDPFDTPGQEITEAAAAAVKEFAFIDGSRQAAGGASYGGHLTNWLQATTSHFKCLISHAGLVNSESQWGTSDYIYHREIGNKGPVWEQNEIWKKQNPIRYAANFKTPMLITVGENDYRVPLNNSLENWAVHQRLKIPSKLIVFPEENHWILRGENSRFFYKEVQDWLKNYLK